MIQKLRLTLPIAALLCAVVTLAIVEHRRAVAKQESEHRDTVMLDATRANVAYLEAVALAVRGSLADSDLAACDAKAAHAEELVFSMRLERAEWDVELNARAAAIFSGLADTRDIYLRARGDLSRRLWERAMAKLPGDAQVLAPACPNSDHWRPQSGSWDSRLRYFHFDTDSAVAQATESARKWRASLNDPTCKAVVDGDTVRVIRTGEVRAGALAIPNTPEVVLEMSVDQFRALARMN